MIRKLHATWFAVIVGTISFLLGASMTMPAELVDDCPLACEDCYVLD